MGPNKGYLAPTMVFNDFLIAWHFRDEVQVSLGSSVGWVPAVAACFAAGPQ